MLHHGCAQSPNRVYLLVEDGGVQRIERLDDQSFPASQLIMEQVQYSGGVGYRRPLGELLVNQHPTASHQEIIVQWDPDTACNQVQELRILLSREITPTNGMRVDIARYPVAESITPPVSQ